MVHRELRTQAHQGWDITTQQRQGDRQAQQDRVGYRVTADNQHCILTVADGLGGHLGGEEAASAAVSALMQEWENHPGIDEQTLRQCFDEAMIRVAQVSAEFGDEARTTCVAALLGRNHACWTHLGDSRLYVFRQGDTIYRSKDHSVARLMVEMGELSEEEARTGPEQGRLYKSLGPERDQEYQVYSEAIAPDDGFLLCTDGFWVNLSEAEMSGAMQANDLKSAFEVLVDLAVSRSNGSSDNVTVCAARPALNTREGHLR